MTKEKCPFQTEEEELWEKADKYVVTTGNNDCTIDAYIAGYHECQKEHEWHYVKDGYLPKGEHTESEKVYAIFKNNSYYIVDRAAVKNYDDLIAWIELPKLPTELSKKWVDNYEDYQNASNDITFSQYPVYRGK